MSPLRSVVSSKRLGGSGTGGSSTNSVSEAEQVSRVCPDRVRSRMSCPRVAWAEDMPCAMCVLYMEVSSECSH